MNTLVEVILADLKAKNDVRDGYLLSQVQKRLQLASQEATEDSVLDQAYAHIERLYERTLDFSDELRDCVVPLHEYERHQRLLWAFDTYAVELASLLEALFEEPDAYDTSMLTRLGAADDRLHEHRLAAVAGDSISAVL